jgi:NADH:ubiquinone oxidoreductase subunit 5 (subunit L)/multisubunit Na+/H+ antiporter MnhA subunit
MDQLLSTIYAAAVLLPLASFALILCSGQWLGRAAGWLATGAILGAGILSFVALGLWLSHHFPQHVHHGQEAAVHQLHDSHPHGKSDAHKSSRSAPTMPLTFVSLAQQPPAESGETHAHAEAPAYTGEYYTLGQFGNLRITISYYIDALTVCMFCMVTLIATCIHIYAVGYMHDELHDVTDNEVSLANGEVLRRPGRFPRFFQYMSLFSFSMLGLVLAGNIAMVFVFWELVGICSYFLIGFYIERKSATNAANKAFIVNRVGDFGMIVGLLVIWSTLGTFAFGNVDTDSDGKKEPGLFELVRPGPEHALIVPAAMVRADAKEEVITADGRRVKAPAVEAIVRDHARMPGGLANAQAEIDARVGAWRSQGFGYWLFVLAGIGIFCGCVGKSAQFPLHVWLPDAMEGPTPVSALVHSATMVAAGVYLVGRFFPFFAPEVLLVIAVIGTITMLLAASIAFAAYDIKRVLAYSTVSQLGLMMLALGLGGWLAGLMHLVTHAFFKSLLFLCSGSVIHAVHTNDMRKMGGLFRKMPVTAITMLIGCLAIAGVSVPFVIGFSGYYSKDAILEQALSFWRTNQTPQAGAFFVLAVLGAALTTCYMFRMWFMTFVGEPRDPHAYEHAHESPPVMTLPLVVLAVLALSVAWNVQLLGYFGIAAAFFLARGVRQGWFQRLAPAHGHAEHGHGHIHDEHHHHEPAAPALTWSWVAVMLVTTVAGGWLIDRLLIRDSWLDGLSLAALLEQARPAGTLADIAGHWVRWSWPNEHASHAPAIVTVATLLATASWIGGILLASAFFWWSLLSPDDVRRQFAPVYRLLVNKWWFDELYDFFFVQPALIISRVISGIDKRLIDGFLDATARSTVWFSNKWDLIADRTLVDGLANLAANWTYSLGLSLRAIQTGRIRQYVVFIVVGAIAIFVLISFFWSPTLAR